jgi:N-acetylmuramate 1-kinase
MQLSMSTHTPSSAASAATSPHPVTAPIQWASPARQAQFDIWLKAQTAAHGLDAATCRAACADASFRRYFRIDRQTAGGFDDSFIIMDAPPEHENCQPFAHVTQLMQAAHLRVPSILAWDEAQGFMLLSDLGSNTLLQAMQQAGSLEKFSPNLPHYKLAIDALIQWQLASQPGVLPIYDEALLRRELQLFPDWYIAKHKDLALSTEQAKALHAAFDLIVTRNLASPSVYVHRDFMPRNLMVGRDPSEASLGILDFQDAVYGPITYDIASLMRDAFLSWNEDAVLDVTVRYWQQARKAGLISDGAWGDWASDFGGFYSAVEWMGLQRHLKILGIFARLTLRDGKPQYLADTPRFIAYVRHTASRYIELKPLLQLIDEIEGIAEASAFAFGRVS